MRYGDYLCRVIGQGSGESKEKKTPYFELLVEPLQFLGPDGPEDVQGVPNGSIKFWITGKTVERVIRNLKKFGWPGGDFESACNHDFKGIELEGTVTENDAGYPQWDLTYRPEVIPLDNSKVSQLNRLFGKSAPKGNPPQSQALRNSTAYQETAAVASPNGPKDEDIPF